MTQVDRVRAIVEPSLDAMGYEVVRVSLSGGDRRPQLQIMAERTDRHGMTVDDCARISRAVSALLDVEDPIDGPYTLEVSSPGIDRPLIRAEAYERFRGHIAKIETRLPVEGRKRFRGRLDGLADANGVRLIPDGTEDAVVLPLAEIHRARLILTDELIAATASEAERAAANAAAAQVAAEPENATDNVAENA
jgi:ribosome maturation factor RimP